MGGGRIFVIKVLANIEGLSHSCARDLLKVSGLLSAVPVVVGERMKSSGLSDGVVYDRHGIHVVSPRTFGDFVGGCAPSVFSVRGNYCVRVDPERLRRLRARFGLSQEELAERLGVTKQSVYRYESNGRISADVADRLEGLFGAVGVLREASLEPDKCLGRESFDSACERLTELKREVMESFRSIGFRTSITNAPFDMVVSDKEMVYTAVSDDWRRLERKIGLVDQVSDIMGGYSVCVTRRRVSGHENVLSPSELSEMTSVREFLRRFTRS
jgi:putative transcriptional regulator